MTTKKDLANSLRQEFGLSWRDSYATIETILKTIKTSLQANTSVSIRGFGTFDSLPISTKRFRDIHSGEIVTKVIPNRVRFKPSKNIFK